MPGKGRRSVVDKMDLDLIPIMNLVSILIPFLLLASGQVQLAIIDSAMPAIGAPSEAEPPEEEEEPPLNLSVVITDKGFSIKHNKMPKPEGEAAVAATEEGDEDKPTIPCKDEQGVDLTKCETPDHYDYLGLTKELRDVQKEYAQPDDNNVILAPESKVQYEVLIRTMDASRDEMGLGDNAKMDENGVVNELFPFVVVAGGL